MIRWWWGLVLLVAGCYLGFLGAERVYDARARAWIAQRDSLTLAVGMRDAETVQREREAARWQRIADSLAAVIAAAPVPAPREPLPVPAIPAGTPSDSAAYWRRDALAARARADSLSIDIQTLREGLAVRDQQLAATAHLLALARASDSTHTAERDSALALAHRAPLGAPRCRLLAVLPCPEIVAGYGATLAGGVVRAGPSVTVGWVVRL